jgi:hypothetical protein
MNVQREIKRARTWHPSRTFDGRVVRAMNEREDEWRRVRCNRLTKSTIEPISSIWRLRLLLKTRAINYLPMVLLPCLCRDCIYTHAHALRDYWSCGITMVKNALSFHDQGQQSYIRNIISFWFSGNILKCTPTRLNSRTYGCIRSGNRLIWHIFLMKMKK